MCPHAMLSMLCGCRQVRSAAEEYHAEFAAKESTIATLTAEAESARSHMQAEIDKLRSDMEVCPGPIIRCEPAGAGCLKPTGPPVGVLLSRWLRSWVKV